MGYEYKVKAFVPKISGCGGTDSGWDAERCTQFEQFLNIHASGGWRLQSSEYRTVITKGCGGGKGTWLVCVFERQL